MNRREFLRHTGRISLAATALAYFPQKSRADTSPPSPPGVLPSEKTKDWLARWQERIVGELRSRACDKEMGEEIGWLIAPILNGCYYGYLATRDTKWIGHFVDWTDSWLKRAVTEPDGFPGWPKGDGGGGDSSEFSADSLLGEAMALRAVVLMSREMLKLPSMKIQQLWEDKAKSYQKLAMRVFEKWDSRDCWREVKDGGLWVVPEWGVDLKNPAQWSAGYAQRKTTGFSNPDNKQNHIARWLLAMHDVLGDFKVKPVYKERAEKWFRLMRSRMRTRDDGKYFVWNYWDPAGPWDYKPDGSTRHWVSVHPNGGYYEIDVEAIVAAWEHGLIFSQDDINKLIATNRDFMWNHQMEHAKFQRIDGGDVDVRWKNSPGVLWTSLVPYDETLRNIFLANHDPASWSGLGATPWYLSLIKK